MLVNNLRWLIMEGTFDKSLVTENDDLEEEKYLTEEE